MTMLSSTAILDLLPPSARAAVEMRIVADVDSTNSMLLREAATLPARVALLADRQTAGRGRRGRRWQSPPGANLYLSLFARLRRPLRDMGGLSIAAGIACATALRRHGVDAAALKWPNDLLADGAKLGGLLVEIAGERNGEAAAVIGLGLNLAMPADAAADIEQPWTDLTRLGHSGDRAFWAAAMLDALLAAVGRFERDGLGGFLAQWAEVDAMAGREVEVHAGEQRHVGTVLGLADDGALRLAAADGERRFHSAEVSLRVR
jgi:BirA family transcriptional regulator, biotin operon repressor / biotin---[acetyl-CoA-carboxylase] ligase